MKRIITMNFLLVLAFSMTFVACRDPKTNIITGAVTDVDGNTYDAVKIGDQIWMKDNLAVTHLRDSTPLEVERFEGYGNCFKKDPYGYYYSTDIIKADIDSPRLCPSGWHLPSKSEWEAMIAEVSSNSDWVSGETTVAMALSAVPSTCTDTLSCPYNTCGFSALPGGFRVRCASFPPTHISYNMSEVNRNCYYWVGTINEENMDPYSVSIDADNGMVTLKKTMQTYPLPSTTFGSWIIFSNTYMPVRCVKD